MTGLRDTDLALVAEQPGGRFKTGDLRLKSGDVIVGTVQKSFPPVWRRPVPDDPVDAVSVGPVPVKTKLVIGDQVKHKAAANAQRQTKDINSCVEFVADDGAPGDQPVVFQHAG